MRGRWAEWDVCGGGVNGAGESDDDKGDAENERKVDGRNCDSNSVVAENSSSKTGACAVLDVSCLAELRILTLKGCAKLTDANIDAMAGIAPSLRSVELFHCPLLSEQAFISIEQKCKGVMVAHIVGPNYRKNLDRVPLLLWNEEMDSDNGTAEGD
eukprot:GHVU01109354.1.p1 GENE.GHVU01109354.1~~GHVU01109354.1.p1  ORF type:complete len:156 (-),score=19.33 GHVU01109354.1:114-581(-)